MYDPARDELINECESDEDSIYEDEDETTRIIPPTGKNQHDMSKIHYYLLIIIDSH